MCCYQSIVNQIIKRIIQKMHQTNTTGQQREWTRDAILDAEIIEADKVVLVEVPSEEIKQELTQGELKHAFRLATALAYPEYSFSVVVKQPLKLPVFEPSYAES